MDHSYVEIGGSDSPYLWSSPFASRVYASLKDSPTLSFARGVHAHLSSTDTYDHCPCPREPLDLVAFYQNVTIVTLSWHSIAR